jgi:hypothetical protein
LPGASRGFFLRVAISDQWYPRGLETTRGLASFDSPPYPFTRQLLTTLSPILPSSPKSKSARASGKEAAAEKRPPELTGLFVAGAIATYVGEQLVAGKPATAWEGLPELMRFATGLYFGEEAAEAEFESARVVLLERQDGGGSG